MTGIENYAAHIQMGWNKSLKLCCNQTRLLGDVSQVWKAISFVSEKPSWMNTVVKTDPLYETSDKQSNVTDGLFSQAVVDNIEFLSSR